ncbi:c-type cytochrome [Indioceanicola profundi]|uniref:c-type cytochrome n=1 Tax=Indioceanicola profundi TaxID=2220096 RepID=UPI000E6AB119|nr:cytochrome c4 [Indioceanicola profundi]
MGGPPPARRKPVRLSARRVLAGLTLLATGLAAAGSLAQHAPIPPAGKVEPSGRGPTEPDLMNGQYVMTSGGSAGHKGACLYCHGALGEGDGASAVPRLAGLPTGYLRKQMHGYARGTRPNEAMTPIAMALTEAEILDVSAYFEAQTPPFPPPPPAPPEMLEQARRLALEGDPQRGLRPCAACHGQEGEGAPPAIPYLAGQWASVIEGQLMLWRNGVRNNDPLNSMRRAALLLTYEEIQALSLYYAGLRGGDAPLRGDGPG